jgi:O-6-methylguanine DNA methyltransferase
MTINNEPMTDDEPLEDLAGALAGLGSAPPPGLRERVVARWVQVPGPLGSLYVASTEAGIAYLRLGQELDEFTAGFRARFGRPLQPGETPPDLLPALAADTDALARLRFDLRELTGFARDVLDATRSIPAGETRPYGWVAKEIGRPAAVRAVGSALARNPVPILIPCHRVTRTGGELGEYVFGRQAKQLLLRAERADAGEPEEPGAGRTR